MSTKEIRQQVERAIYRDAPSKDEYFGFLPFNQWRTESVQNRQEPRSQVFDEYTEIGQRLKKLRDKMVRDDARKLFKKSGKDSWSKWMLDLMPTSDQIKFTDALRRGNIDKAAKYASKVARTHLKTNVRKEKQDQTRFDQNVMSGDKSSLAKILRDIEEFDKVRNKKAKVSKSKVKSKKNIPKKSGRTFAPKD